MNRSLVPVNQCCSRTLAQMPVTAPTLMHRSLDPVTQCCSCTLEPMPVTASMWSDVPELMTERPVGMSMRRTAPEAVPMTALPSINSSLVTCRNEGIRICRLTCRRQDMQAETHQPQTRNTRPPPPPHTHLCPCLKLVHLLDLVVQGPHPHCRPAAGDEQGPVKVQCQVLEGQVLEGGEAEDADAAVLDAADQAVARRGAQ